MTEQARHTTIVTTRVKSICRWFMITLGPFTRHTLSNTSWKQTGNMQVKLCTADSIMLPDVRWTGQSQSTSRYGSKQKIRNIYEPILFRTLERVRPDIEITRGVSLAALKIMPVQVANMTLRSQLTHSAPSTHLLTYTLYPPYRRY